MTLVGYQQQDAHEYLQCLLNQLHTAEKHHSGSDTAQCRCIIHRLFFGKLRSDLKCSNCGYVAPTTDPFMDLNLDLKDRLKTNGHHGSATSSETSPTLISCLDHYTKPETLSPKEYKCHDCKERGHATKKLTIRKLPPILCITLKVCPMSNFGMVN
jgi:ubiquitin carboxyl-terminal hydrolase 22/27/51